MWNWTENQVILLFIRHGETKANKEHRYLGRTDEVLSEEGIKALLKYKRENYYPEIKYLFSSPMKRCLETAKILYPDVHPVIIPEWKEIDFGQFEYKNYKELKDNIQYQSWVDNKGRLPFPGGESRENFISRCEKGLIKMCDELGHILVQNLKEAVKIGIIVHGGTIMALLSGHNGKHYFDYQVLNGRGYICRIKGWGTNVKLQAVREL